MKSIDSLSIKAKGQIASGKWSLCIGAGVSRGLVPTWDELARRVVNNAFSSNYTYEEFHQKLGAQGWSLDSWIQAAANKYKADGKSDSDFSALIEKNLYEDLRKQAQIDGLEKELVLALNSPRQLNRDLVFQLCDFFYRHYSQTSLVSLAEFLVKADKEDKLPFSIITFNADTLLHTLFELFQRRDHYNQPPPHSHPEYRFRTVFSAFAGVPHIKRPIFHIHGAIKPRGKFKGANIYDSRDKLVFLEQDYLKVATSASTWPETLFMYQSQSTNMVFVGLSMSDPNIRRWLGSGHGYALEDVRKINQNDDIDFVHRHYWFTSKSGDQDVDNVIGYGLGHLGVKTVFLNSWSELQPGLLNMLAIEA
ncbi:hypothetical protein ACS89_16845 [Vibrio parahaemolyticus]|uniref:SIR2 family protein n=1 Tax=Vibrio parahaemolyticus TaxID=670 RepID=UPI0006A6476E|nr:SIR2 family protein [Vibrio parahaemolyticus]KOE09852.1 hypothetical protein ACS90_21795 [Vibrio parahaemolyticus]KOE13334.1 hypothetical protein ACS89_16845 [Vibrio parahaemolyticus]KOF19028.1 hypothetical protein ACX16_13770 [Vibrio parahaemolyticus]